ncbi:MAG: hypothetical protein RLZZ500_2574 [Bacteroidota bacterium]|jgi:ribosomal protein S18 acetylase RimI-like enzyme
MQLRVLNTSDVPKIAEIHLQAFKGFFLTSLGKRFIETYYAASIKGRTSICVGLFDEEGNLIGFATGTSQSAGFHKAVLLQNFLHFTISLLMVLMNRPLAIVRLIKNLNKKYNKIDDKQYAELLSIALLPSCIGLGYGKILLEAFEKKARDRQVAKIALTTDSIGNDKVIEFYKSHQYEVYYEFIGYPNRKMLKMIKNVN